jgi:hypothetical protein
MVTELVYHYLIITHHGSHYDWHVWDNWYLAYQQHPALNAPSKAVRRVLQLLGKAGI